MSGGDRWVSTPLKTFGEQRVCLSEWKIKLSRQEDRFKHSIQTHRAVVLGEGADWATR